MQYFQEARHLWQTYVPRSGQAKTVQGELIRAVEKLRDEAHRNGNVNWDDSHEILARFLRDTLVASGLFAPAIAEQIDRDVARLLNVDMPETDDAPYDRLTDRVVEWAREHPDPVPHKHNPDLHR
ncbi:hypothetical protein ACFO0M_00530 [Micromonospora mangrovi]|uniref:Uncharacterized protein n=2 Tax=Micromonospora TaxID=1873 RepID=A0AAU7MAL0_9ACTN